MKKKSIIYYLIILLPFLIAIGFSTWVIIYEFGFGPNLVDNGLSSLFGTYQEKTFTGDILLPDQLNGDTIDSERISYEYKSESDSEFFAVTPTVGPINKGTYQVKIIVLSEDGTSENCIVEFKINPKKLIAGSSGVVELSYNKSLRKYEAFVLNKNNYIKFYEENGAQFTLYTNGYSVDCMHNGVYYYGDIDKIDTVEDVNSLSAPVNGDYLIGSTYLMNLTIKDSNYLVRDVLTKEYTSTPHVLLKYKTAIVNNKLFTIEEAIKEQSGIITLSGDSSTNNTSFVSTSFSMLTEKQGNPYLSGFYENQTIEEKTYRKFTINSNNTLLVPYKDSTSEYEELDSTSVNGYIYSNLIIPDGINLVISSSAKLYIGGKLAVQGRTSNPAVLLNNGLITLNSGSLLKSYGYLKGTGLVNANSGSTVYDVMIMHEWSGGSAALKLSSSCFPTIAWTFHNISCPLKIYKGASLRGYTALSLTGLGYIPFDFLVIGSTSTTSDCLFRPSSNSTNSDYILKKGSSSNNDLNTTINISNKLNTQKDVIEIHGQYEDNSLKISYSIYSFNTDTSISVPISNMDVKVLETSTLKILNSSYVFLLGTSLEVDSEATLNIESSDAYLAFDRKTGDSGDTAIICPYFGASASFRSSEDDAKLIINGSVTGSGKICGNAETTKSGGQLNVTNYSVDSITFKSAQTEKRTITSTDYDLKLYGLIGNTQSQSISNFNSGTAYVTTEDNSVYFFTTPDNVKIFTLEFYDEDKSTLLKKVNKQVLYAIDDVNSEYNGKFIYEVSGVEYTPFRQYYSFSGWKQISDNNDADNIIMIDGVNNNISLYAIWSKTIYSFEYLVEYENLETGNPIYVPLADDPDLIIQNRNSSFDYTIFNNGNLSITTSATYNDKVFYGWYIGTDESGYYIGDSLSKDIFDYYVNNYENSVIPLYACFKDYEEYTINFVDNQSDLSFTAQTNISNGSIINWPGMDYYKDSEKKYYCLGWYFNSEYTGSIISNTSSFNINTFSQYANENNEINVYGNFAEKRSVVYKNDDEILATKYYLSQDDITSLGVPNFEQYISYTPQKEIEGYTYSNWIDSNGNTYAYDGVTISTFTSKVTELQLNKTPIPYKITITNENTSITVTVNGSPVTSGGQIPYNSTVSVSIEANDGYKNASYTVTNDTTGSSITVSSDKFTMPASDVTIKGTAEEDKSCVVSGTLLTLADGTQKKVEDLLDTDMLLVFNHETGKFESAPIIFVDRDEWKYYDIVNLEFSNGTKTRLIYEHGYFDLTLNKYVYITEANYKDYIGHEFAFYDGDKVNNVTLTNSYITNEYVGCYSPVTAYHLNYFVDGMLSMPGGIEGLFNIFDYNDDMTYDIEKMNEDIEKYGLYTYEDFKDYLPYEVYLAFPGPYLKVSVEKGYITFEEIIGYIEQYLGRHGLDK